MDEPIWKGKELSRRTTLKVYNIHIYVHTYSILIYIYIYIYIYICI